MERIQRLREMRPIHALSKVIRDYNEMDKHVTTFIRFGSEFISEEEGIVYQKVKTRLKDRRAERADEVKEFCQSVLNNDL